MALKNKAGISYPGCKYRDPRIWYENSAATFRTHLWRKREKAKTEGWYESIPSDYHLTYLR